MINYQEIEFIVKVPQYGIEDYLWDLRNTVLRQGIRTIIYSKTPTYNID
jgi:hypothetical protein